eukprot:CAMPEP_0182860856 /NCGR_PEP_ID=MMETSP0034_2-20130328/5162_1 /TAXON_ID=156128 /ORGANISM="Nephroselmis pyriformis, Strain CCMP717" /LENGTH=40 /DNA_ID= /DNA_START= /DNA_END= /DNA_ORIENTATION=
MRRTAQSIRGGIAEHSTVANALHVNEAKFMMLNISFVPKM